MLGLTEREDDEAECEERGVKMSAGNHSGERTFYSSGESV